MKSITPPLQTAGHNHDLKLDRTPLLAIAALAAFGLTAAMSARFLGVEPVQMAAPAVVSSATLVFEDGAAGEVFVRNAADGALVFTFGKAEGGFARTTLRAFAYTRRYHDVGRTAPLLLEEVADGRIVLRDPATEKIVFLDVFGDANADQFRAVLASAEAHQGE